MKEGNEVPVMPADRKAAAIATIEQYKKENPAKYELKKAALDEYLARL